MEPGDEQDPGVSDTPMLASGCLALPHQLPGLCDITLPTLLLPTAWISSKDPVGLFGYRNNGGSGLAGASQPS